MSNIALESCTGFIKNSQHDYFSYELFTKDAQSQIAYPYDNELIILNIITGKKIICQGHQYEIHKVLYSNNTLFSMDSHKLIKWGTNGNALSESNILRNTFDVTCLENDDYVLAAVYQSGTLFYNFTEEIFLLDFEADFVKCSSDYIVAVKDKKLVFYDIRSKELIVKTFKSRVINCNLQNSVVIVILTTGYTVKYEYTNDQLLKVFDLHFVEPIRALIKDAIYFITADKILKVGFDFKLQYTIKMPNILNIAALMYDDDKYIEYVYCTDTSLHRFVKVQDQANINVEEIGPIIDKILKVVQHKQGYVVLDKFRYYELQNGVITPKIGQFQDCLSIGDNLLFKHNYRIIMNDLQLDIKEDFEFGGYSAKEFSIITKTAISVFTIDSLTIKANIKCNNVLKVLLRHSRVYVLKPKSIEYQSLLDIELKKKIIYRRFTLIDFEVQGSFVHVIVDDFSILKVLDVDSLIHLHTREYLHSELPADLSPKFLFNLNCALTSSSNKVYMLKWNKWNQSSEIGMICSGSSVSIIPKANGFLTFNEKSIKQWNAEFAGHFTVIEPTKQDLTYFRIVQLEKPYKITVFKDTLNLQQLRDFFSLKGIALTSEEYNELISEIEVQSSTNLEYKLDLKQCLVYTAIFKQKRVVLPTILDSRLTEIGDVITLDELAQFQQV